MIQGVQNNNYSYQTDSAQGATSVSGTTATNNAVRNHTERSLPGECQTCKNRKYVDGSNESDVSFKTPGHIDPKASASVVRSHEQEHVANAIQEGSKPNATLLNASVRLQTAICPECGTPYVSGGVTSTTIEYKLENPYQVEQKSIDATYLPGQKIDEKIQ